MLDNRQVRVLILAHVPDVFFGDFHGYRRPSRQMACLFLKVCHGRFFSHVLQLTYHLIFHMSYCQPRYENNKQIRRKIYVETQDENILIKFILFYTNVCTIK
jgi:hypothetical protein